MKRLTVGLSVAVAPVGDLDPVHEATTAERLGFDFVSVADHPFGGSPTNEPWVTLAWIGASTTKIGLLTRVLGVPFRNPALVAKMAETLDRLSGGRVVLGLGGGGADDKMRSAGITPPSAAEKITALAEATKIVRGMWSTHAFTHAGDHWSVDRVELTPKPSRQIPLWLGVLGPRGARLAGEVSDGWIPHLRYMSWEQLREGRRQVAIGAERAGRDPADLTFVVSVEAHVGALAKVPNNAITGPPEAVAEGLAKLRDLGFDGFNISAIGPDRAEQPARLAEEVLPILTPGRTQPVAVS